MKGLELIDFLNFCRLINSRFDKEKKRSYSKFQRVVKGQTSIFKITANCKIRSLEKFFILILEMFRISQGTQQFEMSMILRRASEYFCPFLYTRSEAEEIEEENRKSVPNGRK